MSIDITRLAPDTTRHAPDTTRHHQTWSRHHQIPPHMHHVWFVWSKTSYSWDKWRCYRSGRTTNQQAKIELLSFWSVNRWVSQYYSWLAKLFAKVCLDDKIFAQVELLRVGVPYTGLKILGKWLSFSWSTWPRVNCKSFVSHMTTFVICHASNCSKALYRSSHPWTNSGVRLTM